MISIEKYNFLHFEALTSYQLDAEQARFVRQPWQWFEGQTLLLSNNMTGVTILENGVAIGFFVLDRGMEKFEYTNNQQAILLRSFSINPNYQGNGFATAALAPNLIDSFIYNLSPKYNEIVLAVNPLNQRAYQLYLRCGFQAAGRVIINVRGARSVLVRQIGATDGN
ncbi:GNAT family N-acetyltransferase [Pasteurella testudinis]|uniref:GNAT family N-acetyltransferase n=1 Tax=Pasteurella testudinis TaxID=761 RepID=UPI004059DD13